MRGEGWAEATTCVTQGPGPSGAGGEEEVSQWAQQFMPQNSDFPFQPTEPRHLSQQDPTVGEGTGARGYLQHRAGRSLTSTEFLFRAMKSMWPTEHTVCWTHSG